MSSQWDKEVTAYKNNNKLIYKKAEIKKKSDNKKKRKCNLDIFLFLGYIIFLSYQLFHMT